MKKCDTCKNLVRNVCIPYGVVIEEPEEHTCEEICEAMHPLPWIDRKETAYEPKSLSFGEVEKKNRYMAFKDNWWNAEKWSSQFKDASKRRSKPELHFLREIVFRNTQEIVENGGYVINGNKIHISDPDESLMFDMEILDIRPNNNHAKKRTIQVVSEDCLLTARRLADKNPLVLNMASRRNPGGGVESGAGAQEECLFRSSNYYRTLYPIRSLYPMDRNFGGSYSSNVTVFRGLEDDGYPLLEEPFKTNFVAVAALSRPYLNYDGSYTTEDELTMKNKIRTILNIAVVFAHKVLILSAFGCGAFHNPPHHVARLFKEVLDEPIYKGNFEEIYFSIKPDHNDVSGNYKAFREVFGI